jgi:hypothetical protein
MFVRKLTLFRLVGVVTLCWERAMTLFLRSRQPGVLAGVVGLMTAMPGAGGRRAGVEDGMAGIVW